MKKFIVTLLKSRRAGGALAVLYFTFWSLQFLTLNVHAYIDPATTSMVIQIVAGVFISLGFAFGIFRRKIVMFFKNLGVKLTAKKLQQQTKDR